MDKAQILNAFWNSFGWKAYDEGTVPDDTAFPYITYNVSTDSLDNQIILNASLWDRSSSWERVSKKSEEIAEAIEKRTYTIGGNVYYNSIPIDNPLGRLFLTKGVPFAQRTPDSSNDDIRRIYLNLGAEFFTEY